MKTKISILSFLAIVLWACEEDIIDANKPATSSFSIAGAKAWYESHAPLVKPNGLLTKSGNDDDLSDIFNLQPLLDWSVAELSIDSVWDVVELPWEYEDVEEIFALSEVWGYTEANNLPPGQIIRLVVIRQRQTGDKYGFKMKIAPDLDYLLERGESLIINKYLVRDSDLSGLIIFCTLDDRFINGWRYRNGEVQGKLVPANVEETETSATVSGTRSEEWNIELDEVVIVGYRPKSLMHANLYTQENGYLVFPVDKKERPGNVDTSGPVVDTYGGGNDSDSENTVPVPELDNVDEIILDDSFKDTKAECVYNKLLTLTGGFQKAIQKFDGEFPVSHLNFSVSYDLPANVNGRTYPPQKFITEIAINGNNLDRPNLSIARTIIHETIHAEMFRKLLSAAQKGELNTDEWTQVEIVQYINNMQNDFPGIYHFYYLQYKKYGEEWDHEQMAGYYRGYMVSLMNQFDPSQPEDLYEAMAWEGLIGTEIWNSLSSAEKSRINSLTKNYNEKGGEPCE